VQDSSGRYWLQGPSGNRITPSGSYDFVTSPDGTIRVARPNSNPDFSTHLGLSGGVEVSYAGYIRFANKQRGQIYFPCRLIAAPLFSNPTLPPPRDAAERAGDFGWWPTTTPPARPTATTPTATAPASPTRSSLLSETLHPNGSRAEQSYDGAGRIRHIDNLQGTAVVTSYDYQLDANGNRTRPTNGTDLFAAHLIDAS